MTNVWVVRAEFGKYTDNFVNGGYVAIGWMPEEDLSKIKTRDEIYPIYRLAHPNDTSNIVIGQQVGQIARFLLGLARRAPSDRRRILVSAIEHKCVLAAARSLAEREGFLVETIPVDGEGFVDLKALEAMVDETVLVVSVMAVNNEVGTIHDIEGISKVLLPHGVLFHCDAAQALHALWILRALPFTPT